MSSEELRTTDVSVEELGGVRGKIPCHAHRGDEGVWFKTILYGRGLGKRYSVLFPPEIRAGGRTGRVVGIRNEKCARKQ